jgi:outer membrane lipoprotein-sorting protein
MGSIVLLLWSAHASAAVSRATQLVLKSEEQTRGKSFQGTTTMTVMKGGSTRSITMKVWTVESEKALIKILKPAKDMNTGNLRLNLELWQYLPNIDQLIRIPPSMMLQSWMGSDFTNDDIVKTSSLARDYTHSIVKEETVGGFKAVQILCTPKPTAPVVWGKVVIWVRAADAVPLKQDFYSESGEILKEMVGTDIKSFGTHTIPTTLKMTNLKNPDSSTTLHYDDVVFDRELANSIFTQNNLRKTVR